MNTQVLIMIVTLLVFVGLGFALSRSIKNFEEKKKLVKKKKGRGRYMQEFKNPGK